MDATTSTRWEFLQPFYRELSSRWGLCLVPARTPTTLQAYVRGFDFMHISADPGRVAAVRDGLELILLQSLVDHRAFLTTVFSWIPVMQYSSSLVFLDEPDAIVPCYLRVYCPDDPPAKLSTFLSTLLIPTERRSDFLVARARIIALIDSAYKQEDADRIRHACAQLKISVEVVFPRSTISSRLLRLLTQFQQQMKQSAERDTGGSIGVYRLDNMSVRVKGDKITVEAMELLQSIVAYEDLELKNRELSYLMGPRKPRPSTVQLAKALLALTSTTDPKQPDTGAMTVESTFPLGVDGSPMIRSFTAKVYRYDTGFRQICSSLMVARDIEAVNLGLVGTNNNRAFQNRYLVWLFHALFSSSSSHAIRHVSLPIVSVSTEQLEQMQRYSQCSNPAAFLHDPNIWGAIDLERECMRPRRRVIVAKGTPLTCRQSSTLPHEVVGHLHAAISCDVLYDGGKKGVHVLVPGYGHCRVPPSRVEWEEAVQPWPSLKHRGIKSLTINGRDRHDAVNIPRFCSLLAFIGDRLEEIRIKSMEDTTTLLGHILAACPRLKAIRLFGASDAWEYLSIVDAYRTGACKATTLDLMGSFPTDPSADTSIVRFFYALGNQRSAIAATVEQLSVSLRQRFAWRHERVHDADASYAEPLQAVEKMLASNRKLRVFTLDVTTKRAYTLFAPLRRRFHGQYFSSEPLPDETKLAFLSALRRNASTFPVDDAMARLDSFVITIIFQLAATPIKRTIKFRYDRS